MERWSTLTLLLALLLVQSSHCRQPISASEFKLSTEDVSHEPKVDDAQVVLDSVEYNINVPIEGAEFRGKDGRAVVLSPEAKFRGQSNLAHSEQPWKIKVKKENSAIEPPALPYTGIGRGHASPFSTTQTLQENKSVSKRIKMKGELSSSSTKQTTITMDVDELKSKKDTSLTTLSTLNESKSNMRLESDSSLALISSIENEEHLITHDTEATSDVIPHEALIALDSTGTIRKTPSLLRLFSPAQYENFYFRNTSKPPNRYSNSPFHFAPRVREDKGLLKPFLLSSLGVDMKQIGSPVKYSQRLSKIKKTTPKTRFKITLLPIDTEYEDLENIETHPIHKFFKVVNSMSELNPSLKTSVNLPAYSRDSEETEDFPTHSVDSSAYFLYKSQPSFTELDERPEHGELVEEISAIPSSIIPTSLHAPSSKPKITEISSNKRDPLKQIYVDKRVLLRDDENLDFSNDDIITESSETTTVIHTENSTQKLSLVQSEKSTTHSDIPTEELNIQFSTSSLPTSTESSILGKSETSSDQNEIRDASLRSVDERHAEPLPQSLPLISQRILEQQPNDVSKEYIDPEASVFGQNNPGAKIPEDWFRNEPVQGNYDEYYHYDINSDIDAFRYSPQYDYNQHVGHDFGVEDQTRNEFGKLEVDENESVFRLNGDAGYVSEHPISGGVWHQSGQLGSLPTFGADESNNVNPDQSMQSRMDDFRFYTTLEDQIIVKDSNNALAVTPTTLYYTSPVSSSSYTSYNYKSILDDVLGNTPNLKTDNEFLPPFTAEPTSKYESYGKSIGINDHEKSETSVPSLPNNIFFNIKKDQYSTFQPSLSTDDPAAFSPFQYESSALRHPIVAQLTTPLPLPPINSINIPNRNLAGQAEVFVPISNAPERIFVSTENPLNKPLLPFNVTKRPSVNSPSQVPDQFNLHTQTSNVISLTDTSASNFVRSTDEADSFLGSDLPRVSEEPASPKPTTLQQLVFSDQPLTHSESSLTFHGLSPSPLPHELSSGILLSTLSPAVHSHNQNFQKPHQFPGILQINSPALHQSPYLPGVQSTGLGNPLANQLHLSHFDINPIYDQTIAIQSNGKSIDDAQLGSLPQQSPISLPGFPHSPSDFPHSPPGFPNSPPGFPNSPPGFPNSPPGFPNSLNSHIGINLPLIPGEISLGHSSYSQILPSQQSLSQGRPLSPINRFFIPNHLPQPNQFNPQLSGIHSNQISPLGFPNQASASSPQLQVFVSPLQQFTNTVPHLTFAKNSQYPGQELLPEVYEYLFPHEELVEGQEKAINSPSFEPDVPSATVEPLPMVSLKEIIIDDKGRLIEETFYEDNIQGGDEFSLDFESDYATTADNENTLESHNAQIQEGSTSQEILSSTISSISEPASSNDLFQDQIFSEAIEKNPTSQIKSTGGSKASKNFIENFISVTPIGDQSSESTSLSSVDLDTIADLIKPSTEEPVNDEVSVFTTVREALRGITADPTYLKLPDENLRKSTLESTSNSIFPTATGSPKKQLQEFVLILSDSSLDNFPRDGNYTIVLPNLLSEAAVTPIQHLSREDSSELDLIDILEKINQTSGVRKLPLDFGHLFAGQITVGPSSSEEDNSKELNLPISGFGVDINADNAIEVEEVVSFLENNFGPIRQDSLHLLQERFANNPHLLHLDTPVYIWRPNVDEAFGLRLLDDVHFIIPSTSGDSVDAFTNTVDSASSGRLQSQVQETTGGTTSSIPQAFTEEASAKEAVFSTSTTSDVTPTSASTINNFPIDLKPKDLFSLSVENSSTESPVEINTVNVIVPSVADSFVRELEKLFSVSQIQNLRASTLNFSNPLDVNNFLSNFVASNTVSPRKLDISATGPNEVEINTVTKENTPSATSTTLIANTTTTESLPDVEITNEPLTVAESISDLLRLDNTVRVANSFSTLKTPQPDILNVFTEGLPSIIRHQALQTQPLGSQPNILVPEEPILLYSEESEQENTNEFSSNFPHSNLIQVGQNSHMSPFTVLNEQLISQASNNKNVWSDSSINIIPSSPQSFPSNGVNFFSKDSYENAPSQYVSTAPFFTNDDGTSSNPEVVLFSNSPDLPPMRPVTETSPRFTEEFLFTSGELGQELTSATRRMDEVVDDQDVVDFPSYNDSVLIIPDQADMDTSTQPPITVSAQLSNSNSSGTPFKAPSLGTSFYWVPNIPPAFLTNSSKGTQPSWLWKQEQKQSAGVDEVVTAPVGAFLPVVNPASLGTNSSPSQLSREQVEMLLMGGLLHTTNEKKEDSSSSRPNANNMFLVTQKITLSNNKMQSAASSINPETQKYGLVQNSKRPREVRRLDSSNDAWKWYGDQNRSRKRRNSNR